MKPTSYSIILILLTSNLWAADATYQGSWSSTFGPLQLFVHGTTVQGTYVVEGELASIEGTLVGRDLTFTYKEKSTSGEGSFQLAPHGQTFSGRWREKGSSPWKKWTGKKISLEQTKASIFGGIWKSTFGSMRLQQREDKVRGIYSLEGGSFIDGRFEGRKLTFDYREEGVSGEGWFHLSEDGKALHGRWRPLGKKTWKPWNAIRVEAKRDIKWLVVVEAPWQGGLAEREYSFGNMLKSYFAGSDKVRVRHRFFTDAQSLQRWCREVAYLAEPVILCITTHGTAKGLQVNGKVIGPSAVAHSLDYDDDLLLLHFSACKIMKSDFVDKLRGLLPNGLSFPVSGYKTAVDWAGSAITEFLYFDLILDRGYSPAKAFEQVQKMFTFAGDTAAPGCAIENLGFTFHGADQKK